MPDFETFINKYDIKKYEPISTKPHKTGLL